MASPTQWTWVWASSGRWWWIGKPGVLQSMGLPRVGHDWATEQLQYCTHETYIIFYINYASFFFMKVFLFQLTTLYHTHTQKSFPETPTWLPSVSHWGHLTQNWVTWLPLALQRKLNRPALIGLDQIHSPPSECKIHGQNWGSAIEEGEGLAAERQLPGTVLMWLITPSSGNHSTL